MLALKTAMALAFKSKVLIDKTSSPALSCSSPSWCRWVLLDAAYSSLRNPISLDPINPACQHDTALISCILNPNTLHDHQIRITSTPLGSLAACWNYRTWIVNEMRNLDPRSVIHQLKRDIDYLLCCRLELPLESVNVLAQICSQRVCFIFAHLYPPSLPPSLPFTLTSPFLSHSHPLFLPFSLPSSFSSRSCLPVSGSESSTEEWAAGQKRIPNWLRLYESLQVLSPQHQLHLIIPLSCSIFLHVYLNSWKAITYFWNT